MHVKPKPGRSVPDPDRGGLLAADGREVNGNDTYWLRRIESEDVEVVKSDPSEAAAVGPPPTTSQEEEGGSEETA